MGRGPKPTKGKAKPAVSRQSPKSDDARVRDLEKRLAESLEREKAAGEILRVISRSPASVQPIFEAIARAAMSLCEADIGSLFRFDGQLIHLGAFHGTPKEVEASRRSFPQRPGHGSVTARAILAATVVQIDDVSEDPEAADALRAFRTVLSVPMIRDGRSLGAITVARRVVRPFSDEQIELVKTFADQAVIAIENVRLFTELESRNRDLTATGEILQVISRSPTDVQPVFDVIIAHAHRLCDGVFANAVWFDGELMHNMADHGFDPEAREVLHRAYPRRPTPESIAGRAILAGSVVQSEDMSIDNETTLSHRLSRLVGARAYVSVPMLRDGISIGAIIVARRERGLFPPRQVELLKTFADQAVIAIENVRLFTALQEKNQALTQAHAQVTEALEQQTATAEILRVISQSPTDVQPVFDAVAEAAMRLCEAEQGILVRFDGELMHLAALAHFHARGAEAMRQAFPIRPGQGSVLGRAVTSKAVAHVPSLLDEAGYRFRELALATGFRNGLAVPMLKDDRVVGAIGVSRLTPGAFSDRQIALLQTFADQAVIAIENVRLFTELQDKNTALTAAHAQVNEALEQQTATSEILRVISSSPTDVQPVFDAIAESSVRLCDGLFGAVYRFDGELMHFVAHYNFSRDALHLMQGQYPTRPRGLLGCAIRDRAVVHSRDVLTDPRTAAPDIARALGYHSYLAVPMLRESQPIGGITVCRAEAEPFSNEQIKLLQTFADQAVIAIENVRLFTETKEALERQTATGEILSVISKSPTDVRPVFEAICQSAVQLFNAYAGAIIRFDGKLMYFGAVVSPSAEADERYERLFPRPPDPQLATGQAILGRTIVQISDIEHEDTSERNRTLGRSFGYRRLLVVPMVRHGIAIGALAVTGREPGWYSDRQIALLQTFADQAVIAIENVRLFSELQASNHDLTEALEQQTATAEVLKLISRSTFDLGPVLETLIDNAARLCRAEGGCIYRTDGALQRLAAAYNMSPEHRDFVEQNPVTPGRGTAVGRAILERRAVHIHDVKADPSYTHGAVDIGRYRTLLGVPMMREDVPIGVFAVWRTEVLPFTDKQIELVTTFADQGAIAIANVRLLSELQARTAELSRSVDELTALGEVGRALSSTLDLEAVLQTIVTRATQLTEMAGCVIWEYDKPHEEFRLRVSHYTDDTDAAVLPARGGVTTIPRGQGLTTKVMEERQAVQIPDITVAGAYESLVRKPLIDAGHRALLGVPLLSEDEVVGVLAVTRKTPGEFEPETVRLLSTFATQSALAIQNARLFREIEQKSRELEAASRHKSEFLANMSHELRTPLNAIIGFAEVLSERMFGALNEKQDEYLKDIHASGQHLLSLINDILDLSKIEAGRMELEVTEFDLPMAIDNALTLVRERAARRGIVLHTTVDQRVGQIQADERKVRQVLLNLLSNAIKFTPEGGRIGVQARPVNGSVEVSVSDTGVGIAPEDQETVFEEFRQVGTADKKVEGTGLGLALSRKFIELHGGKIWVKSQVGHGSTFTFTVPVRGGE